MPDGKRIQDLNIDDIPSIRRNPIICDLFSRLKLMERRGSGLRKIMDQYPEDAGPSFRSTEQSFIVTLKNLNYAKLSTPYGADNGDEVGVDNGDEAGVDNGDEIGVDNGGEAGVDNGGEAGIDNGDEAGIDNGDENNINLVLNAILENPKITQKNIAIKTGLSTRTVSREIRELRSTGIIRRVGSDRSGYWEIVE